MSDTPKTDAFEALVNRPTNWWDFARELERENAALRADKERLDFLDAIQWHGGAVTSPMMDGTRFRIQVGTRPVIYGNTIRAAIDAARKEAQP